MSHFSACLLARAWFTHVRLLSSHLTPSKGAFSVTLTTTALDRSSSRWFETSPCRAIPEGQPPSPAQHRIQRLRPLHRNLPQRSWHTIVSEAQDNDVAARLVVAAPI